VAVVAVVPDEVSAMFFEGAEDVAVVETFPDD
jgi:hypothetical protein